MRASAVDSKKCNKCGEIKPLNQFYKDGNKHHWCCKECQKQYQKEHPHKKYSFEQRNTWQKRYREKHHEKCLERQRIYAAKRKLRNLKVNADKHYVDQLHKVCTKCKQIKLLSMFSHNSKYADGLDSQCTDCKHKSTENWRKLHIEHRRTYYRNHYRNDEAFRKRRAEKDRRYRNNNKEKILMRNRNYIKNNFEKVQAYRQKYNFANRAKVLLYHKNYYYENYESQKELRTKYYYENRERLREEARENIAIINGIRFNKKTCQQEIKPIVELCVTNTKFKKALKKIKGVQNEHDRNHEIKFSKFA